MNRKIDKIVSSLLEEDNPDIANQLITLASKKSGGTVPLKAKSYVRALKILNNGKAVRIKGDEYWESFILPKALVDEKGIDYSDLIYMSEDWSTESGKYLYYFDGDITPMSAGDIKGFFEESEEEMM